MVAYPIVMLSELDDIEGRNSAILDVPLSTGSPDCIQLAREWITECWRHHHKECPNETSRSARFVPSRLLYVGDNMSSVLRLRDSSRIKESTAQFKYLALSHCWGDNVIKDFQKLTTNNKELWEDCIDEATLPLNFRDAIMFTRQVGCNYLWVDSLCIIQDDKNDWVRESEKMGHVYANAYCTISSSGSVDATGGCFHERNPFTSIPCYLRVSDMNGLAIRANKDTYNKNTFGVEVDSGPLSKRAWTFQERLLSQRIVHFTKTTLFFECNTHFASEVVRGGVRYSERRENRSSPLVESRYDPTTGYRAAFNALKARQSPELSTHEEFELHESWFSLIAKYTSCKLTHADDRLIAIFGISKAIIDSPEEQPLIYWEGLWHRHLLFDLLWCLETEPAPRPTPPRAPSWSWGAVDGRIGDRLTHRVKDNGRLIATFEKAATIVNHLRPPGRIVLGCLILPINHIERSNHSERQYILQYNFKIETPVDETPKDAILELCCMPDTTTDFETLTDLYCAELLRIVDKLDVQYQTSKRSGRSEGIVLRRTRISTEPGMASEYMRVGRFWAEWTEDFDGFGIFQLSKEDCIVF